MLRPLVFLSLNALERLIVAVIEVLGQLLLAVCALLELGARDRRCLAEVAIAVEDLVHFVFNFGLQIEIL